MNSSTGTGVSGARPHSDRARTTPVDSKMFMLCTQLLKYYIINSIGSLTINILCLYSQGD